MIRQLHSQYGQCRAFLRLLSVGEECEIDLPMNPYRLASTAWRAARQLGIRVKTAKQNNAPMRVRGIG